MLDDIADWIISNSYTTLFAAICPDANKRWGNTVGQPRTKHACDIEFSFEIEEEQIESLQYEEDDQRVITAPTKISREIHEILGARGAQYYSKPWRVTIL